MLISEIDRIINEVNGSMTIEGMPLTNEDVIFSVQMKNCAIRSLAFQWYYQPLI